MQRAGYWILGIFFILVLAAVSLTRWYKVSLVHVVVKNAVLQKAPPASAERIEAAFERARAAADRQSRSEAYMETLFAISQRVEKVQKISPEASQEIIRELDDFTGQKN